MDRRLVKAARDGDVMALHDLMEEDPQILARESLTHYADSVLHVAALQGKADFVKQIVTLKPLLATATNQKGLIPLHMASAQGHVMTVKELLKANLDDENDHQVMMNQSLVKEDYGWTPLHYAVSKGKVAVIEELIRHCPDCVGDVTAKRETVFHLAVKANQLKVVEVLVESIKSVPNFQTLLKAKDINGNTVYDLAAEKKQLLQVLEAMKEDDKEGDKIREEHSISVGEGRRSEESEASHKEESNSEPQLHESKSEAGEKEESKDAILVVATLIITLTYQALANPLSPFIKEGSTAIEWGCLRKHPTNCPAVLALLFIIFNSLLFFQSIYVVIVTLQGVRAFAVRLLTVYLVFCYSFMLTAINFNFLYLAIPYALLIFIHLLFSKVSGDVPGILHILNMYRMIGNFVGLKLGCTSATERTSCIANIKNFF